MKPKRPPFSLMNNAASEAAAMPMPPSASSVNARRAIRPAKRDRGASSPSPTTTAETKFSRNSVPIVGTTR